MTETTVVHLLRHGEVFNPEGILYGRIPGYGLSDIGLQMADRVAATLKDRDITHLVSSPLERARHTAQPSADALGLCHCANASGSGSRNKCPIAVSTARTLEVPRDCVK